MHDLRSLKASYTDSERIYPLFSEISENILFKNGHENTKSLLFQISNKQLNGFKKLFVYCKNISSGILAKNVCPNLNNIRQNLVSYTHMYYEYIYII